MRFVERLKAWGHPLIEARHTTTFEITKDPHLTARGDCILAVAATKGARDLSKEFRAQARNNGALMTCRILVGDFEVLIRGRGDPRLTLTHATDMVVRKSAYVCSRTLMIHADKSSAEFPRKMIRLLRNPAQPVNVLLEVET